MARNLKLTRDQLAAFAKDPETVRQLELLITRLNDLTVAAEGADAGAVGQISDLVANLIQLQEAVRSLPAAFDPAPLLEALQALNLAPPAVGTAPVEDVSPGVFDPSDILARLQALELGPPPPSATAPLAFPVRTITVTETPLLSDFLILVDATAGAVTVDLPAAAGSVGRQIIVKKVDASANAVTLDGSGAETIDGAGTLPLPAQWDVAAVICNGTAWFVV